MSRRVTIIRGGIVVDAAGYRRADVMICGQTIEDVGPDLSIPQGARVLDAGGSVVAPGFVDLHSHLREPGFERAETVLSGARAAAKGGYSAVVAMPNTNPPVDHAGMVRELRSIAAGAPVHVAVAGCITAGRAGGSLAPLAEMAALGVRLFTDDGNCVEDPALLRRALEYGLDLPITIAEHCEDPRLASEGCMHEGAWSDRLGLPGVPAEAEEFLVARDCTLARLTGGRLHLMHLSSGRSLGIVRDARSDGARVTAEVTPHHLSLTDAAIAGYDPVYRVNPPLRPAQHVEALQAALAGGDVDAVATDHAPHTAEAKERPFDQAAPGMLGLETALSVLLTFCWDGILHDGGSGPGDGSEEQDLRDGACGRHGGAVQEGRDGREGRDGQGDQGNADDLGGRCSLVQLIAALTWRPAAIAGLAGEHGGPLKRGGPANLCVFDPRDRWTVDPARLASKSRNTPFRGMELTGRVIHTVVGGETVLVAGEPQA